MATTAPDHELAVLVREVMKAAREKTGKSAALVAALKPRIGGRLYDEKTVSAWIRGTGMPPADVFLAAIQVAGISIDERLGIGRKESETERIAKEALDRANEAMERFRQWEVDHPERDDRGNR